MVDGFMYSVGFLVAYITVLLVVLDRAARTRANTMADLLAYRLKPRPRALASLKYAHGVHLYMIARWWVPA